MRTLRDLDAAALILAQAVEFVFLEERDGASLRQALAEIGSAAIENAIERTRHLARPPDDRHFQELCASWRRIKRLFEGLLGRITFEAAPVAEPVREALAFLAHTPDLDKGVDASGTDGLRQHRLEPTCLHGRRQTTRRDGHGQPRLCVRRA